MEWNAVFFVNSVLLGVGLAMDAFSVCLANGMLESHMSHKRMCAVSSVYGLFQLVMPLIGWVCVHTIVQVFGVFELAIPWIALGLLAYIGIKMVYEGLHHGEDGEAKKQLTVKVLLVQGIATSIDALSVGFTIADYEAPMAIVAALLIAIVTFIICLQGLRIGRRIGTKLAGKASIIGGIILIGIGIEIFVTGMLGI